MEKDNLPRIYPLQEDPNRKSAMIADLMGLMQSATEGQGHLARLNWLLSHLEEYLERWTGCLQFLPMASLVYNDLHTTLLIGLDLVEEELKKESGIPAPQWLEFVSVVRSIDKDSSKDISQLLRERFVRARDGLVENARRQEPTP